MERAPGPRFFLRIDMSDVWPPAFDGFASFDFTAEGDTWAWFEPVDGMEFENDHELRATLTTEL
jgi:hypothetical protein